jgi:hypothetical protein
MQIAMRATALDQAEFDYPLDNGPLHDEIIRLAQFHEEIVLSDRRFGVQPAQLVRVRGSAGMS